MKRLSSALASAALVFASVAAPAFAHTDEAVSSPAAEETVSAGVIPISITFEEDLLQSPDFAGSDIVIQDALGNQVPVLCSTVDGAVLATQAEIATPGTALVTWRTVADDGHAISGSYSFEVDASNGYVSEGVIQDCPNHLNQTPMPKELDVTALAADSSSAGSGDISVWLGFGIAVIIIFAFAVIGALRARRVEAKSRKENR